MAESWIERLKPNDYVNVAGPLESYKKVGKSGKSYLSYQVRCFSIHMMIFLFLFVFGTFFILFNIFTHRVDFLSFV